MSNDNWYTPEWLISIARKVMGGIDLDPASCEEANKVVKASVFYDKYGEKLPWHGRVWLNPPYSRGWINAFVDKAIEEKPNLRSCMILVNNDTETRWFQKLAKNFPLLCLLDKRIKFTKPGGEVGMSPRQGQAIFYYDKFSYGDAISKLGKIGELFWRIEK